VTVTGAAARRRRSIGRWLRQNSSRSPTSAPSRRRFATVVVREDVQQLRMVLAGHRRRAPGQFARGIALGDGQLRRWEPLRFVRASDKWAER